MKKTIISALVVTATMLATMALAGPKVYVYLSDGDHIAVEAANFDSLSLVEPGVLKLDPESKSLSATGGRFAVAVTANKTWTAKVSDPTALTLSAYSGTGSGTIYVNASANADSKAYTEIVTVTLTGGVSKYVYVTVAGATPGPTPTDQVTDACDNTYPVVKIGEQYWMAENLRCNKYATQSEAYNASWLTNNTVPTSENYTYTPYYTDASDKSKWYSSEYAGNLTDAQVAKLGYLYNWAAAVGVADGEKQTKSFTSKRQGICPNGWHIPSRAEWQTLQDYIEKTDGKGTGTAGKHLKTTSGWYDEGNPQTYPQGLDTYGFAALPAGYANGSEVSNVGYNTGFWAATPRESYSSIAYGRGLVYDDDFLYDNYNYKDFGPSVRCLRN